MPIYTDLTAQTAVWPPMKTGVGEFVTHISPQKTWMPKTGKTGLVGKAKQPATGYGKAKQPVAGYGKAKHTTGIASIPTRYTDYQASIIGPEYGNIMPSGQAADVAQGAAQGAVGAPPPAPAAVAVPGLLSSVGFWQAATTVTALVGVLAYHYKR